MQACWEFLHRRHPKPCAPLARLSNQSTSAQMRWDAWCRKELNRGHLCLVGEVDNARACSCRRRGRMHMHAGSGWRAWAHGANPGRRRGPSPWLSATLRLPAADAGAGPRPLAPGAVWAAGRGREAGRRRGRGPLAAISRRDPPAVGSRCRRGPPAAGSRRGRLAPNVMPEPPATGSRCGPPASSREGHGVLPLSVWVWACERIGRRDEKTRVRILTQPFYTLVGRM